MNHVLEICRDFLCCSGRIPNRRRKDEREEMTLLTPQIPMYRQVDRSLGEPVSTPKRNETLKRTMEWQQKQKGAGTAQSS